MKKNYFKFPQSPDITQGEERVGVQRREGKGLVVPAVPQGRGRSQRDGSQDFLSLYCVPGMVQSTLPSRSHCILAGAASGPSSRRFYS